MTAHFDQSTSRCGTPHRAVIIHALAPVIGPYMSRAITTIHIQEISGTRTSSTARGTVVPQRGFEDCGRILITSRRIDHQRINIRKHRVRQVVG
jgi:hypothetical protein